MKKKFGVLILSLLVVALGIGANTEAESPAPKEQVVNESEGVLLYPNPIANELNVQCSTADIDRVEIWNFNRQMIFSSPIVIPQGARLTVNMNAYPSGYYAVKVFFKKMTEVQTFQVYKK